MRLLNHILKRIFLCSFFVFSLQQTCYAEIADELLNAVVSEAASIDAVVNEAGKSVLAEGLGYINLAREIYLTMKEIKSLSFPSKEEIAHAEKIANQYAFLSSRKGLRECLRDNRATPDRMDSGLATACKEIADLLLLSEGEEELNRVTAIYNEYRKSMG